MMATMMDRVERQLEHAVQRSTTLGYCTIHTRLRSPFLPGPNPGTAPMLLLLRNCCPRAHWEEFFQSVRLLAWAPLEDSAQSDGRAAGGKRHIRPRIYIRAGIGSTQPARA